METKLDISKRTFIRQILGSQEEISLNELQDFVTQKYADISNASICDLMLEWEKSGIAEQNQRTLNWKLKQSFAQSKPINTRTDSSIGKKFAQGRPTKRKVLDKTSNRLIQHLAKSKQAIKLQDLVRKIGTQKKEVNRCLYDMQQSNLVQKVQEQPPHWMITSDGQRVVASSETAADPAVTPTPQMETAWTATQKQLLHGLGVPTGTEVKSEPQSRKPPLSPSQRLQSALDRTAHQVASSPVNTGALFAKSPSAVTSLQTSFAAMNKNPVSALLEWGQKAKRGVTFELMNSRGPSHMPRFETAVFVDGQQVALVETSNKKDGKREAADRALRTILASEHQAAPQTQTLVFPMTRTTLFDEIAGLSHTHFEQLASRVSQSISGRKVMAAIVMKMGPSDSGTVISMGTGNRCITGKCLSLQGHTVNDSHAEIIARRGFMRFMYQELMRFASEGSQILVQSDTQPDLLKVKDTCTFHLYITTAPCGDGALFSPRENTQAAVSDDLDNVIHEPEFSSKVQGLFRTKLEGGEGTIPIESDFVPQTWDGILRGERLRTMSCSDKICRWNVLGLQGALLANFMEPVYLSSLTLGYLFEHGHLARATCCRLAAGDWDLASELPAPYRLNHPLLGRVTAYDPPRETEKTKQMSLNWAEGDAQAEVTDGTTGMVVNSSNHLHDKVSQVSKCRLYHLYQLLCERLHKRHLLTDTYSEAKQQATSYQSAKALFMRKIRTNNYGVWVKKPPEEEQFG